MINKRLERQKIERLLPWHAAGTLSRREAELVERALAGDTELAQRYDLVRQELAETIHLNETLGAPSEPWRSCSPQSRPRRRRVRHAADLGAATSVRFVPITLTAAKVPNPSGDLAPPSQDGEIRPPEPSAAVRAPRAATRVPHRRAA
jgi:hypothetical protein